MTRFKFVIALISVCILVAPSAEAAFLSSSGRTSIGGTSSQSLEGDAVAPLAPTANALEGCGLVVEVETTSYRGLIVDERTTPLATLVPKTFAFEIMEAVPVYEQVSESYRRIVDFDAVAVPHELDLDLAIEASWFEQYVEWTESQDRIYVEIQGALGLLQRGLGSLVVLCDPDEIVQPSVSAGAGPKDGQEYDYFSPVPVEDGWTVVLTSVDVSIATDDQRGNWARLPESASYTTGRYADIDHAIQRHVDRFEVGQEVLEEMWGIVDSC